MSEPDDDMQRVFRDLPDKLRRDISAAVKDEADGLAAEVSDAAPEGETGHTKESVRVEPGRDELEFIVRAGGPLTTKPVRKGTNTEYDYALAGEFGTQHQPADPWFYPTCRENVAEINERLVERVQEILDEA